MAPTPTILLFFLLTFSMTAQSPAPPAATPYHPPTPYDLLDKFLLPRALLPRGARHYLLHADGTFELYLDDACYVEAAGYHVHYNVKTTGKLQTGAVTDLKGVYVRTFLFVWVRITGVESSDGVLTVHVGPIKKSFPVEGFSESPRCRKSAAVADA